MRKSFYLLAAVLFMAACGQQKQQEMAADILPAENFDTTINNIPVKLYTLKAGDIVLQATNFGGRVVTIFTPDKNGKEDRNENHITHGGNQKKSVGESAEAKPESIWTI